MGLLLFLKDVSGTPIFKMLVKTLRSPVRKFTGTGLIAGTDRNRLLLFLLPAQFLVLLIQYNVQINSRCYIYDLYILPQIVTPFFS